MPESYPEQRRSRTPFLITTYVAGADGELIAEMPACCPRAAVDERCALSIHHGRRRKTGPQHLLTVVGCATHGSGFTLYPPGYAPYLRQPVQRLSPDGREVASESKPGGEQASELEGTVFEAAVDGKRGHAWSRCSDGSGADRWWGTQGRHLRRSARLIGIARDLADSVREAIGATLSVGVLVLRDLSAARGYRAIGQAVCGVLQRLRGGARRAVQLLVCGHLAGHWGAPWCWDAARQVVERSPFPLGGTMVGG